MGFDHQGARKRRREIYNVDTKLVEIYEDLASEKDEIRLKAAQGLISQFTPDKNPTDEQIKKTLQRLFRGLCSSRKAARIGFSVALTELLTQIFSVKREDAEFTLADALKLWESLSHSAGSESGQEQRDHHFGRLFGAEALIKSGVLFLPITPFTQWTQVLDLLFELAQKKPWLREECGWVLYRCVYDLSARQMDAKYLEAAIERLCSYDLARSPEGIAVWLAAKDMFPKAEFPTKVWKHDDPLDAKERNSLAKIMKESSAEEADGQKSSKSSGVWNSKLHFAWDAVLSRTTIDGSSKAKGSKNARLSFSDFWTEVVDNGLFASASSEERKFWGFLLFNKVLNEGSPEQASQVFTKNLVRCLMNQLAVEDRYLHRMAIKTSKSMQARVSKEPSFAAPAVRGLMGSGGAVLFDQVTKTKTVEKIVADASSDALKEIIPLFEQLISRPSATDDKTAAADRQFIAGLLLSIVRAKASTGNSDSEEDFESVLEQILFIFVRFAYFTDKNASSAPEPAVSESTQEMLRNRVSSSLNSLLASQKYAATIPYAVVKQIRDGAKSGDFGKFIINIDDKLQESVKTAFKSLKKLSSKEKKGETSSIAAFKLLYSMTVLQVYNGDADAVSMLDELEFCYTKFLGDEASKKKKDTSDASDALVEILLSFASKQSQLFRRMSEQVFGAFADQVTENGLESLISILEAKESLAGQQEMFDQDDDDDVEEEGEGSGSDAEMMDIDGEEDSDVEVIEAGEANSDSDSDSGSEEEDEEEEDDTEEDAAEVAAFEAKLAAALGTHRADKDLNANDSDSDSDMDDDQMDQVDTQLANVFRARRDAVSQQKDKKDARSNMVNFKNRVLDLLEIFVKKSHSRLLALDLLLPLLRLTRRSTVKQIANKANTVLREYTKLCKGTAVPKIADDEGVEAVWELLRSVHKEAGHSGPPAHATAVSQASLLVVKVLVAHDKGLVAGAVDVYGETRKDMLLSTKSHVQPSFFTDWNNWCVSASKQLKN